MIANSTTLKKRSKPKKYVPTDFIDGMLRQLYLLRLQKGTKKLSGVKTLAKKINWPDWALKNRAKQLGLPYTKETPWSEPELKILAANAHLTVPVIAQKLRKAGFSRSATAVNLKLKRLQMRGCTDYFSATQVANLFGCDSHLITKWISLKMLKAKRRGTARTTRQGGDQWLIHQEDIRAFVYTHPTEFDMRKITNQLWFLDLITHGAIAGY